MEPRETCRLCSASVLVATMARTGGLCMPCFKDGGRAQRQLEALIKAKVLDRKVKWAEITDPHEVIKNFEFMCFGDGLEQVFSDELIVVLAVLKRCKATKCKKVITDLLDFIEAGCSPEGYYNPKLEEAFLMSQSDRLDEFVQLYQQATLLENPADRALKLE